MKKKTYTKYVSKYKDGVKDIEHELGRIAKFCTIVRVIAHTQVKKLNLRLRKALIMEIQLNGGADVKMKVDLLSFCLKKKFQLNLFFQKMNILM